MALGLAATANLPATLEALAGSAGGSPRSSSWPSSLNWALRFAKWQFYLGCLDVPLPWRPSLRVFLAGFTMAISPGKLGEVLKAVLVRDLVGTPVSLIASVVMAERLTDVAGLVALGALGVTALPRGPLLLGGIALVLLAAAGGAPNAGDRAPGPAPPARPSGRARPALRPQRARAPVDARAGGGRRAVDRLVVLRVRRVLADPGRARRLLPLRATTFVYAFAQLAGAVSMLPGGLGVAEGSLTGLLAGLGTSLPEAAAATLLVRAATLWLAVAWASSRSCAGSGARADGSPARVVAGPWPPFGARATGAGA